MSATTPVSGRLDSSRSSVWAVQAWCPWRRSEQVDALGVCIGVIGDAVSVGVGQPREA
jgi:hypothetical protein